MSVRTLLTPTALLLALGACSDPTGPGDLRAALEAARQRWEASGVVDYRMTVQRACECPPATSGAVVVVVRGGEVAAVSDAETAEPLAPADAAFFPSIDALFELLEGYLDQGLEIEVDYDPTLGFPVHVFVDPVPAAIDDEVDYDIFALVPDAEGELLAELNDAVRVWGLVGFPNYDLDVRRSCECEPGFEGTVKVRVRSGVVVSRTLGPRGEAVAEEHAPVYPDIAGLFAIVRDALDRGAGALTVEYDPDLRFPQVVTIDYRTAVAGDEVEYQVVKLVRVEVEAE